MLEADIEPFFLGSPTLEEAAIDSRRDSVLGTFGVVVTAVEVCEVVLVAGPLSALHENKTLSFINNKLLIGQ